MSVPYAFTDTSLMVVLDCVPHIIPRSHPNFEAVIQKLTRGANDDEIRTLVDIPRAIESFMQGNVEIRDRVVYYKGNVVHNYLANHIIRFMEANDPALAQPLMAFLDNVMENPSFRAVQGLFEWVQKSNLPITQDGHLMAWKIVGPDYMSLSSQGPKLDNTPGKIVEQDRNLCNEDPDQTCAPGLHFCSYEYLPRYGTADGNRVVIVKVNPRDVVAFPRDYNTSKGRCCRYEVVGEVPRAKVQGYFGVDETLVTSRFSETEKPKFEVGQKWLNRDGTVVTIDSVDLGYGLIEVTGSDESVYSVDLDGYFADGEPDGYDLIELIEPSADILPGQIDMKVGQVWENRHGTEVFIALHSGHYEPHGDVFRVSNNGPLIWAFNGDGEAATPAGTGYLRRLIRDAS